MATNQHRFPVRSDSMPSDAQGRNEWINGGFSLDSGELERVLAECLYSPDELPTRDLVLVGAAIEEMGIGWNPAATDHLSVSGRTSSRMTIGRTLVFLVKGDNIKIYVDGPVLRGTDAEPNTEWQEPLPHGITYFDRKNGDWSDALPGRQQGIELPLNGFRWALTNVAFVKASRTFNSHLFDTQRTKQSPDSRDLIFHARRLFGRIASEIIPDAQQEPTSLPAASPPDPNQFFDRRYRGCPSIDSQTGSRSTDGEAYFAGVSEHDRLCVAFIGQQAELGIEVGEGLHGIGCDLAWRTDAGHHGIAEVKSCTRQNAVDQCRTGLGHVLDHRTRLNRVTANVQAHLIVSYVPDPIWFEICGQVQVTLIELSPPGGVE